MHLLPARAKDDIPARVRLYLLPPERQVITARPHPFLGVIYGFIAVSICAAAIIVTFLGSGSTLVLTLWGITIVAAIGTLMWVVIWLNTFMAFTRNRIIWVPGIMRSRPVTVSVREINEIVFSRSDWGRVWGYGTLTLIPARPDYEIPVIKYMPYPEMLYLEVRSLIFGDF